MTAPAATKQYVGIDFGTTNSAVGVAVGDGQPTLAPLVPPPQASGEAQPSSPTWRSVLYFEPFTDEVRDPVSVGPAAIARYLANDGEGRLVQSIKSHLASKLFTSTRIRNRTWALEDLIGTFLRRLRESTPVELGSRAVIGRPVNYWGASEDADNERAMKRMRKALAVAGFDEVAFVYEPIAAASRYSANLDHDELVFIADFGGGTSDFSVIRVGPGVGRTDTGAILATGGIGIGGDTFDGTIVDRVIAPSLGKGGEFGDEFGAKMPVPPWLYQHLRRWHQLSFLRSRKTMALLDRIARGADEPTKIQRLLTVIEEDLGLPLHQAVEATKMKLSSESSCALVFDQSGVAIAAQLLRDTFDAWIGPDLDVIDRIVEKTLADANVQAGDVDRVFTTGGSSFVPAIRNRLGATFGDDKVVGGDELTSVAWGLAVCARDHFVGD